MSSAVAETRLVGHAEPRSPRSPRSNSPAASAGVRGRPFGELIDLNPRLLRCFVAVAEELHFSRAADRLFLPQPWLSRTVRQLEGQVGAPLFVRNTRSVRLTPVGQRLLPAARDVLEALEAVGRLAGMRRAALRVPHVPGHDTAMVALDRLAQARPEFAVQELAIDDGEQLAALTDGRIDVAVCRLAGQPRQELCCELLRLDPALVALPRGRGHAPAAVDLRRVRVALGAGDGGDRIEDRLALELERCIGHPLPRIRVAAGSGTEVGAFERAGEQAFITFESTLFSHARYTQVATAPVQPLIAWWLVWRRDNISSARQAFIDAARAVADERLWKTTASFDGEPLLIGEAAWTQTA